MTDTRRPLSPFLFLTLNLTLGIGHFLVLFNTGAYIPMIPYAAGSLGHAVSFGDWTQANFFVAMAVAFPVAPWLLLRFGEVRTLAGAFVGFALASAVCATTGHFILFLAARGVQGFAGGITIPISLAAILRQYRPQRRNIGLILWGIASLTPFTLGPTVGGLLIHFFGWRSLFVLNVVVASLVALTSSAVLFSHDTKPQRPPFDGVGLGLLVVGLAATLFAADVAETRDWWRSSVVVALAVVGVVALVAFLIWEWDEKRPLVDVRLFARRNFAVGAIGLFLTALVFQGLLALYIVQFEVTEGYSALWAGLLILPMAVFSKATSVVMHRYMTRIDPRILGFVALIGMAAGSLLVSSYSRDASVSELIWPQVVAGLFVGGLFPPFAAIGLSGLAGAAELRASALLNLLRVAGQGFGIPMFTIFWDRRRILHRHFLGEADRSARAHVQGLIEALKGTGLGSRAAHEVVARAINHAAALLAFNEIFYTAAWIFAALALLLWWARPVIFAERDRRRRLAVQELVEP